jgi:biopolymer transport protein ExbD
MSTVKKGGIKLPDRKGGMDEINITPLIDVVLVLLIIFMVLTPITVQTMASRLPPTDQEEQPPPPPDQVPDQLMIAVYDDNTMALNLQVLDDVGIKTELCNRLPRRAKKTVFIDAHKNANYARVIGVMDVARDCGAENVGFAELTDEGPARLAPGQALPDPNAPVPVPPTP